MIELFAVPAGEDDAFRAAWTEDAPSGATLYRALRDDVPHRYASVTDGPRRGVLLITPAAGDIDRFAGRQGFLGVRLHGDLAAVHWSSPLMYARTGVALPGALYAPDGETSRGRRSGAPVTGDRTGFPTGRHPPKG